MDNVVAVTAGEKIKIAREILGISQEQLAGKSMTRNFISMVENEKTRLTWRKADDIAKNANEFAKLKHLQFRISAKYLMENEQAQIEKMANEYINDIMKEINKDKLIKNFLEAEVFFKVNNISCEKFYRLYDAMIDKYLEYFYIEECKFLIIKALEITNKKDWYDKSLNLYCKLSWIYVYSKKYKEAILLKNHIEDMKFKGYDNLILIIQFNSANAYYKLQDYSKCIEIINNEIKKHELTSNQNIDVEIMEATCIFFLKEYDDAEQKYLKILSQALDLRNDIAVARLYMCLAVLYNKINDIENAYKHIQLSMDLIKAGYTDEALNLEAYAEYLEIMIKYNQSNDEIFNAFKNALNLYIMINNIEVEEKVINIVFEYCRKYKNEELMFNILEYMYNTMINGKLENLKVLVIYVFKAYEYFKSYRKKYKNRALKMGMNIIKKLY